MPRGWSNIGAAPPDHIINVQIGLAQDKVQELERHLYEGTPIRETFFALSVKPRMRCADLEVQYPTLPTFVMVSTSLRKKSMN